MAGRMQRGSYQAASPPGMMNPDCMYFGWYPLEWTVKPALARTEIGSPGCIQVHREIELTTSLQHNARIGRVDGGIPTQLIRQAEPVSFLERKVELRSGRGYPLTTILSHMVNRKGAEATRLLADLGQPDLLDLDRFDIPVFRQTGRHLPKLVVVVRRHCRHPHHRRRHDDIRRADRPLLRVRPLDRRRQVGRVAARGPGVSRSAVFSNQKSRARGRASI